MSQGGLEFEQHHEEAASERFTNPSSKDTEKLNSPKAKSASEKLSNSGKKGTSLWDQVNSKANTKKTGDFRKYTSRKTHEQVVNGEVEPAETPTGIPTEMQATDGFKTYSI